MPVRVIEHPLISHKMTILRDIETSPRKFRELAGELTELLAYEATRNLETQTTRVKTPMGECEGIILKNKDLVVAPVLRAGLGMVPSMLKLMPTASVAHLGLYRDEETLQPKVYYQSMPRTLENSAVFIVDPMLATAGSMSAAINLVKQSKPYRLSAVALIAAPEGVAKMEEEHPDVDIVVAALDSHLNDKGYIVPGLGDAGDRMFGSYKVEQIR